MLGAPASSARLRAAGRRAISATIRTEFGRFGRQVSGYCLEHLLPEHGFDVARAWSAPRARSRVITGRHRAAGRRRRRTVRWSCSATRHGRRRRRGAGAAGALGPTAVEGLDARHRRACCATSAAAAVPTCPAATAGCSSSWPATTAGEVPAARRRAGRRRGGARRARGRPTRPRRPRCGGSARTAPAWRPAPATAGPAHAGLGGRRGAAGAARRLPARVRRAAGRARAPRAAVRALRRRLRARAGSTSRWRGPAARGRVPRLRRGRRAAGRRRTAARCPASTATAGRAASCCRSMYSPAAIALFAQVKAFRPATTCSTPACSCDPRRSTPTCGRRRPHRSGAAGAGLPARRRRLRRGRPPVHRRRQVPGRHHRRGGVMCPSYLATRDEKDSTRGRARVLQEMIAPGGLGRRLALARGARGPRPLPVLQGLRARLPDRHRHGDLQVRGAAPDLPAPAAPAHRTTRSAGCRAGPTGRAGRPRAGQRGAGAPGSAAGWRSGGRRGPAPRRCPPFAAAAVPAAVDRHRPRGGGAPVLLWVDSFTDHFAPEVGVAAVRVLRGRRVRACRSRSGPRAAG